MEAPRPATHRGRMPALSRFYGIVIYMHYRDHPPPHFHARYQEQEVTIDIASGLVRGAMSKRALRLVFRWMVLYRELVSANWIRAREGRPLLPIPPLE